MYIELIGERVLCVCFVLRVHCTFDGDGGSKLQSRSCLSCVFSGKAQVIWVSTGNKQLDPPLEKVGPSWKMLDPLWDHKNDSFLWN